MIGKVIRGSHIQGLIRYLFGPGDFNEHTNPHIVAGYLPPSDLEPPQRPDGRRHFTDLDRRMTEPLATFDTPLRKPIWHYPVRAAPDDPTLTDAQFRDIAERVMHATGLAPHDDREAVRWFAVRHADDHIHIVATLARQDGTRPNHHNDALRARSELQTIEAQYGLTSTAPADRTTPRNPTRGEQEKAHREHRPESPRTTLRRDVQTAAAGARTEAEFFTRLASEGVLIRTRESSTHPGQITGYAVALPDNRSSDGNPIFYSGGKLAPDLTLPNLRHRWPIRPSPNLSAHDPRHPEPFPTDPNLSADPPIHGKLLSEKSAAAYLRHTVSEAAATTTNHTDFFDHLTKSGILVRPRHSVQNPDEVTGYSVTLPGHTGPDDELRWYSGGRLSEDLALPRLRSAWQNGAIPAHHPFTTAEQRAVYDDAAKAANEAGAALARHSAHDRTTDDTAWASADLFRTAARTTGNYHLDAAADLYDRAARPRYNRAPPRSPAGNALRTAARIMAIAGLIGDQTTVNALILIAALTALTESIATARQNQGRTYQANPASAATQRLRFAQRSPDEVSDLLSTPDPVATSDLGPRWGQTSPPELLRPPVKPHR